MHDAERDPPVVVLPDGIAFAVLSLFMAPIAFGVPIACRSFWSDASARRSFALGAAAAAAPLGAFALLFPQALPPSWSGVLVCWLVPGAAAVVGAVVPIGSRPRRG